ncbi:hypothetical protein M404DRAFT_994636 [Pisolithus tinctorius Marx 270]|uniref:Uncharacterized protein n=1 Tax=Pisolithus tinctorius Marx 270 TaxID=870435 RepID=A0A0C3PTB4_PISTI|nr:hypothetical protein M404DRAFT_994636 [Pisolithus tinctorius Marx 270]
MGYEARQLGEGVRTGKQKYTDNVTSPAVLQKSASINDTQFHDNRQKKRAEQLSSKDVQTLQKNIDDLIECTQIIRITSAKHSFI